MPSVTRSLLLNIGVFLADNNIRRSVSSASLSYATTDASATVTHVTVQPGSAYTFIPVVSPTSLLVVNTSLPLSASVTYAESTALTTINRTWVTDDNVTEVVFENSGAEPARLSIIQG